MGVQPCEAGAEGILRIGIAGHHEVDELRDARLLGPRRPVTGNDEVCESFDDGVLSRREKLRIVCRGLDLQRCVADVPAGESPFAETGKLSRRRRRSQNL